MSKAAVVAVLVGALALAGCGVTGPKVRFAPSGDGIAQAQGPGVDGNLSDPDGVVVASGSFYLNPAAAVSLVLTYLGDLLDLGGGRSNPAPTPGK